MRGAVVTSAHAHTRTMLSTVAMDEAPVTPVHMSLVALDGRERNQANMDAEALLARCILAALRPEGNGAAQQQQQPSPAIVSHRDRPDGNGVQTLVVVRTITLDDLDHVHKRITSAFAGVHVLGIGWHARRGEIVLDWTLNAPAAPAAPRAPPAAAAHTTHVPAHVQRVEIRAKRLLNRTRAPQAAPPAPSLLNALSSLMGSISRLATAVPRAPAATAAGPAPTSSPLEAKRAQRAVVPKRRLEPNIPEEWRVPMDNANVLPAQRHLVCHVGSDMRSIVGDAIATTHPAEYANGFLADVSLRRGGPEPRHPQCTCIEIVADPIDAVIPLQELRGMYEHAVYRWNGQGIVWMVLRTGEIATCIRPCSCAPHSVVGETGTDASTAYSVRRIMPPPPPPQPSQATAAPLEPFVMLPPPSAAAAQQQQQQPMSVVPFAAPVAMSDSSTR